MKHPPSKSMLCALFLLAILTIGGCASTGIQRSERATTTMQAMDEDINLVVTRLNATNASLDELTRPGQSDVKRAFNAYSENVVVIETLEKRFLSHTKEMKDRGKDYFDEWQKEGSKYKNAQIQELSQQRRTDLGEIYGQIAVQSVGVNNAFASYKSDVKEIQLYLSNDLTSKGIEEILPVTSKVVQDGDKLKDALRNVQSAIDRARSEMSQAGIY